MLGLSFTLTGVAAVSGQDPETLEARLRDLVRREFLELNVDPRSPERGQYSFVHRLIREVAYGTLSRRDRRTRHLAASRFFESLDDVETALNQLIGREPAALVTQLPRRPGQKETRYSNRRMSLYQSASVSA